MTDPPLPPVDALRQLVLRWKDDPGSTYRSWFLWDERLKNFRSIRRGLQQVTRDIADGSFGNTYRGSSLETVRSIAEQRQLFKGADHAFLWKPKRRIPDIYENPENQRAFGSFLDVCLCCGSGDALFEAIQGLDRRTIKGLGPAVANLLYFLHPTLAPPSNTVMVNDYNALGRALRGFFVEHLPGVRGLSRHTVLSYRDALALFLRFLATHRHRPVVELDLDDLDPDCVIAFLDHLEKDRGNCVATRNSRLAALHAFARYVAPHAPEHLANMEQARPSSRTDRPRAICYDRSYLRILTTRLRSRARSFGLDRVLSRRQIGGLRRPISRNRDHAPSRNSLIPRRLIAVTDDWRPDPLSRNTFRSHVTSSRDEWHKHLAAP